MSVSVNNSYSADMRTALSQSLAEALRSGTAMATGNAITHAYEDPTGLAIGSSLRSDRDILKIIETSFVQNSAVLDIVEGQIKAMHSVLKQLNEILTRGSGGLMNDEMINKGLSKAYNQCKAEFDRQAESASYAGTQLLNGTGGVITKSVPAQVTTSGYAITPTTSFNLGTVEALTDLTVGGSTLTISNVGTSSVDLSNATFDTTGGNSVFKNVTIKLSGSNLSIAGTPAKTGTADVTFSNVTLTFAAAPTVTTGSSTGSIPSGAVTVSGLSSSNVVISNAASALGNIGVIGGTPDVKVGNSSVSNLGVSFSSSGGKLGTSTFKFVTGINLDKDYVLVSLPDLNLDSMIKSLNVTNLTKPSLNGLTGLVSVDDVHTDIPVIKALEKQIITCMNDVGAYQKRFINITEQLNTSVEKLDVAQGAILNADLPSESEIYAKSSVKTNIAIARLNSQNQMLQSLQRIVTG